MKTSGKQISSLLIAGFATVSLEAYASDTTSTPFDIKPLDRGYQMAAAEEGYCGQDKMKDGDKMKQGSCGEGKCGGNKVKNEAVCGLYKVGSAHEDDSKVKDGKCGGHKVLEALCGDG